jgi:hypothetical protein
LAAFDCVILTLGLDELNFALEAVKNNVPICFVRTKCDLDVEDLVRRKKLPRDYTQRHVVEFMNRSKIVS